MTEKKKKGGYVRYDKVKKPIKRVDLAIVEKAFVSFIVDDHLPIREAYVKAMIGSGYRITGNTSSITAEALALYERDDMRDKFATARLERAELLQDMAQWTHFDSIEALKRVVGIGLSQMEIRLSHANTTAVVTAIKELNEICQYKELSDLNRRKLELEVQMLEERVKGKEDTFSINIYSGIEEMKRALAGNSGNAIADGGNAMDSVDDNGQPAVDGGQPTDNGVQSEQQ